jgi:hypothetical protein
LLPEEDDEEEDEPRPELRLLLLADPSSRLPPLSRFFEDWLRELSDCDCDFFDWLAISGLLEWFANAPAGADLVRLQWPCHVARRFLR